MTSCHYLEPRDGHATLLRHTPLGYAWLAFRIASKVFYRLWFGFAQNFNDLSAALCKLAGELDPRATDELVTEWETALGLPDACFPAATTLEERRQAILLRLTKRRWTTAADWQDLAALFGLTLKITPGWLVQKPSLYPSCYPVYYRDFPKLGRFRVYVDVLEGCGPLSGYPYAYAFAYGAIDERCALLKCIIDRVRPASVVVIWNDTPPISC